MPGKLVEPEPVVPNKRPVTSPFQTVYDKMAVGSTANYEAKYAIFLIIISLICLNVAKLSLIEA